MGKQQPLDDQTRKLIIYGRAGDRESLGQLAELTEGRLLSYIYRLTLDYELAQELCQQTLVKMVETIGNLRHEDRFWFWLYRTALGQVQHYFRDQQREREVRMAALDQKRWEAGVACTGEDGLSKAERRELTDKIMNVVMQMRLNYRNVLILRCFEQMSYREIADFMECKELHARVLFFRARHILKQHLVRQGLAATSLGVGLTLFGLFTAHTKSTLVAVQTSTLQVGFWATLIGNLTTKSGILITSCISTLTLAISVHEVLLGLIVVVAFLAVLGLANLFSDL